MADPMNDVSNTGAKPQLIAGRLALDFANLQAEGRSLAWSEFVGFLVRAQVVTEDRAERLRPLARSEPLVVDAIGLKVSRLQECVRAIFASVAEKKAYPKPWVEPINEILRMTEGHDELVVNGNAWKLQFVARENGLEWLLAAIARSAAEVIGEGTDAPVRRCANAECRLFFCDDSRTGRRKWCSMSVCGNRHKVAAFLKRHAGHGGI
jgi:predicted RNA-binding Zn ribbon-like protein